MARTIQQRVTLPASPDALYRIYLSSAKHSAATGARAVVSRKVGGRFTAYGGQLRGRMLALVPGRMIVQSWRGADWKKSDLDSVLVLVFDRVRGGGRISLVHANVPDAHAAGIRRGWGEYYWKRLRAYLRAKPRRR